MTFQFTTPGKSPGKSLKNQQIKQFIYEVLQIDEDIPISLSQLQCQESNCPEVETVITILKQPTEQYKIPKPIGDIEYEDIQNLVQ